MSATTMQCSMVSKRGVSKVLTAACAAVCIAAPTSTSAGVNDIVSDALTFDGSAPGPRPIRLEVDTVPALGSEARAPATPAGRQPAFEDVDYRLWVGKRRATFGVGLTSPVYNAVSDGAVQRFNGPWRDASSPLMVVGVRYQMNDASRLYVGTASRAARSRFGSQVTENPGEYVHDVRVGLEFRPVSRAAAMGLSRGQLLRLQLSVSSQVALRVRGGGLAVVYRSQF